MHNDILIAKLRPGQVCCHGTVEWLTPPQSQSLTKEYILICRSRDIFGQHQGSQHLGWTRTERFLDLHVSSNLTNGCDTNRICWARTENPSSYSWRSPFWVLIKRIIASGDNLSATLQKAEKIDCTATWKIRRLSTLRKTHSLIFHCGSSQTGDVLHT